MILNTVTGDTAVNCVQDITQIETIDLLEQFVFNLTYCHTIGVYLVPATYILSIYLL